MFRLSLGGTSTIWGTEELDPIRVMDQGVLARKRDMLPDPCRDKNLTKLIEVREVLSKLFYILCRDGISANDIATINK